MAFDAWESVGGLTCPRRLLLTWVANENQACLASTYPQSVATRRPQMIKSCPDRSCPGVVRDGSCSVCGEQPSRRLPDTRPPAHRRGYDKRWKRIRDGVLAREPLCRHCAGRGRMTAAELVDHIVPLPLGTHDVDNLQPLCRSCHAVKTAAERLQRP